MDPARGGDAGLESNYDVAVFLRDMDDLRSQMKRLADISTEILGERTGQARRSEYAAWDRLFGTIWQGQRMACGRSFTAE
jgi:hypothetical protein